VWSLRTVGMSCMLSAGDDGVLALLDLDLLTAAEAGVGYHGRAGEALNPRLTHKARLMSTPLPLNTCAVDGTGVVLAGDDAGMLYGLDCAARLAPLMAL